MQASAWRTYFAQHFHADLLAAFVVSVLLIPQSLAYAQLAGLPPEVGLYASLLPLLGYALLGSSPVLAVGPVAVVALMIAQGTAGLAGGVTAAQAALVLALESGLVLALAAALRLDALASLMSVPVLVGFETGATLSIALSQLPVLVGSPAKGAVLGSLLQSALADGGRWEFASAAFGLSACALLVAARRWLKGTIARLAPLLVLLLSMALARALRGHAGALGRVGELPHLAPTLALPPLDASLWWQLLPTAALIALLTYVSSLVVAESLAHRRGDKVVARRELCGLAAANLLAGVSGGMPVAGSFGRSVLLEDAGSRSRLAGALVAGFMVLAMALLAAALAWLPKAVLAASIMVAVLSGLKLQPYRRAWAYARGEALLMIAVTLLVVLAGVTPALALGVSGSIALLLKRTAAPHVAHVGRVPGTEHYRNVERHRVECRPGVLGLRIDESLVFTNARGLADVVQKHLREDVASHGEIHRVVLLMSPVNAVDFSGLEALRELQDVLAGQGVRLDLSEVKGPVLDRLRAADFQRWFHGEVFLSHHQAMGGA